MDALPPSPTQPAPAAPSAYVYAPGDIYPRGEREAELCSTASTTDWLYLGSLLALDVGAVYIGTLQDVKWSEVGSFGGAALIGLTWGATIGGGYLALPKCQPHWVGSPPPEGNVRTTWPIALSLSLLGAATAPILYGISNGSNLQGTTFEREMHIVTATTMGAVGALIPYLIPPKTWRAAKELERVRLGVDKSGMFVSYGGVF